MKNPNGNARLVILAMIVATLAACATRPIERPEVFTGPVDSYIQRSPQVGDTGHVGHVQFVYTPSGWVRT